MPISRVRWDTEYEITPYMPITPSASAMVPAIASITSVNEVRAIDSL